MSDDYDEPVIYGQCNDNFSSCLLLCNNGLKRKRCHSVWVRGYLQSRSYYGAYNCLMRDLEVHAYKLKNYIRMNLSTFEELTWWSEISDLSKTCPLCLLIS